MYPHCLGINHIFKFLVTKMAAINWAFQAKLYIIIVVYLSIVVIFYSYMSQFIANSNIPYATEIKIHFSYLDFLCYTKYANAGSQKG